MEYGGFSRKTLAAAAEVHPGSVARALDGGCISTAVAGRICNAVNAAVAARHRAGTLSRRVAPILSSLSSWPRKDQLSERSGHVDERDGIGSTSVQLGADDFYPDFVRRLFSAAIGVEEFEDRNPIRTRKDREFCVTVGPAVAFHIVEVPVGSIRASGTKSEQGKAVEAGALDEYIKAAVDAAMSVERCLRRRLADPEKRYFAVRVSAEGWIYVSEILRRSDLLACYSDRFVTAEWQRCTVLFRANGEWFRFIEFPPLD